MQMLAEGGTMDGARACQDPLTGLFNRRGFLDQARDALSAARKRAEPVSMLMIDADDFKRLNDMLGLEAGDAAIRQLARVMTACLAHTHTARLMGRHHGARICVLLRDCDGPDVALIGEHMVNAVSYTDFGVPMTVSVGGAARAGRDPALHWGGAPALLAEAHSALIHAKAMGPGHVHVACDGSARRDAS